MTLLKNTYKMTVINYFQPEKKNTKALFRKTNQKKDLKSQM